MRRWVSVLVWMAVLPFAVWAALRLGGLEPVWPWVALVAFTPYAAAGGLAALAVSALARRRAAAGVALAGTLALALAVAPRALGDGDRPASGPRLRVLAANLMVGQADAERLMGLVRELDVDVLALQEVTPRARDRLAGLREFLPHVVDRSHPGVRGSAIYARFPLAEQPMIEYGFRQARAVLRHPAGEVEIVSVHPCAPRLATRIPCWRQGLEALPRAGGRLRVLAGDFNATLDHRPMRDLLDSGYRDAADVTGRGLTATWPQGGRLPGVAIDHVLADSRIGVAAFDVRPLRGTDHRPVFAELILP
ncbi:endonuclease/exonuclease/phosphatase family protein [Thermoactinospora rubra]|uniref:endonuclease/exonuclease/phosphatase family protein n=1 Tax=Thermoactinospora rubra TaxID=1088767 RepID=UPI001F0A92AA|nr:endonuclease/exonuclease/phosphatase family protein [Thermoactinospora rubra]